MSHGAETPRKRQRRLQFGLLGLLAFVAVCALGLWWWRWHTREERALELLRAKGAEIEWMTVYRHIVAGFPDDPLPADEHHYSAFVGPEWKGGNDGLDYLADLSRLTDVSIVRARGVGDEGMRHLADIGELETLSISQVGISDVGMRWLKGMSNLRAVYFEGLCVGDDRIRHLEHLPNLHQLTITGDLFVTSKAVSNLNTNLRYLELRGAAITDEGLKDFPPVDQLQELDLRDTLVTRQGLLHLKHLPRLTKIAIGAEGTNELHIRSRDEWEQFLRDEARGSLPQGINDAKAQN